MAYLLAWRMALAKKMLRETPVGLEQLAQRVGYRSASALSTAFSRHEEPSPSHYAARMRASRSSVPDPVS